MWGFEKTVKANGVRRRFLPRLVMSASYRRPFNNVNASNDGSSSDSEVGDRDSMVASKTSTLSVLEDKLGKVTSLAWKILPLNAVPEWQKDNNFILGSYRPTMFSVRGCFKSMFRLHNETWNIWTHFIGFLFFVILVAGVYTFGDHITGIFEDVSVYELPWSEQAMLCLFFIGAIACLLGSTLFHVLHNHSQPVSFLFSRIDYSGISLLITGSSVPAYYYGFYCAKVAQFVHISAILVLCVVCTSISLRSKFNTPSYRVFRFVMFSLFGLYGAVPFFHIYLRDGYVLASNAYALWGIVIMAFLYIGGGFLYASRIPERFWPGKFDIWASSHQLFHICVFTAALIHYDSLLKMVKYRLDVGSCMLTI